jgi:hypothetical protein
MNDDFCIAMGVEVVATSFEFGSQLGKVINLAIEDRPYRLVFVVNGLLTAGYVDDAEPAHAQADRSTNVKTLVVRSAVNDGLAHGMDIGRLDGIAIARDDSGYPAHDSASVAGTVESA